MIYMQEENLLEYIMDCYEKKKPLEQKLHAKAMHLLKEYMLVWGMPQADSRICQNGGNLATADIEKDANFDRYDKPLFGVEDFRICNLCYKCNDPNVGFALNKNDSVVKLLFNESKTNFKVFPIEVKSSKDYTATSLEKLKGIFAGKIATQYIIHLKNLMVDGDIIKMAPYMFGAAFR